MTARSWLAMLVPPSTWALHSSVCYWCTVDLCGGAHTMSIRVVVGILTLVALCVAIAGGVLGYAEIVHARRTSAEARSTIAHPATTTRAEYVGFAGIFGAFIFSIGIVLAGLPMFLLRDVCESVR